MDEGSFEEAETNDEDDEDEDVTCAGEAEKRIEGDTEVACAARSTCNLSPADKLEVNGCCGNKTEVKCEADDGGVGVFE